MKEEDHIYDPNRLERTAREDEERIAQRGGLLFGAHNHDTLVKRAACIVLGDARGKHCSSYDLRHATGRETMKVTGGHLGATQAALAHHDPSTTLKYLQPHIERGQAALVAGPRIVAPGPPRRDRPRGDRRTAARPPDLHSMCTVREPVLALPGRETLEKPECEGRDLNPHGFTR